MAALSGLALRLPAWVVALVAVACVVLGAVLTLRPFTSVEVLVLVAGLVAIVTGALILVTHMGVLEAPSALPEELTAWTADRFASKLAASTCSVRADQT